MSLVIEVGSLTGVNMKKFCLIIYLGFLSNIICYSQKQENILFNTIESICDSLKIYNVKQSNNIGGYLNFYVKVISSSKSKHIVRVHFIHNYFTVKYYNVSYWKYRNDYLIMYNLDSINSKVKIDPLIKPFLPKDTIIFKNHLLSGHGASISSRQRPLSYLIKKDKIISVKIAPEFDEKPYLIPPYKITKEVWK
ncbi:MAG: hypothetical protein ACK4Y6_09415 [Bacteroidota bacterium]|jgi:hypothetical protein